MMNLARRKKTTLGAAAALALALSLWLGVSTSAPSFAATSGSANPNRHVIKIYPDRVNSTIDTWDARAILMRADGKTDIHRWAESHPGGLEYVRWEYTDGGDGAYIDLAVRGSGDRDYTRFTHLSLSQNHCYRIAPDYSVTDVPDCPFH
jgi:hypothetical protein